MKTTAKHFATFKKECEKWIKNFGLQEWEVIITHKSLIDQRWAECNAYYASKNAELSLNTEWEESRPLNEYYLKYNAIHEVIELLLSDYTCLVASRYIAESEVDNKRHEVIQRIINYILEQQTNTEVNFKTNSNLGAANKTSCKRND